MKTPTPIPFSRRLDFVTAQDLTPIFRRLQRLPHGVWLDSASDRDYDRGRYSFLTADPVAWCAADTDSPDPWSVLQEWCRKLGHAAIGDAAIGDASSDETSSDSEALPPFCGGVVGLLGYESAWWLEPVLRHDAEAMGWDRNLPGMAIGLYDWTIAVDHHRDAVWLLSTGLDENFRLDVDRANARAEQVIAWMKTEWEPIDPDEAGNSKSNTSNTISSTFTDAGYAAGVSEIIDRICRGDSFQVNLAQTLSAPATCRPEELYARLRAINPAPYACYFDAGEYQVISSSPEGFLQVRTDAKGQRHVVTRPIKGTVARTGEADEDERLGALLLASEKDRAENIMIVDLMRNDLSRVCTDESVEVTGLCELERYQRVQHLVSTVRGVLGPDASVCDLLAACFPGGSITGAPKVEAMRTIAKLERRPRGPYCGSLGYISLSGAADFNILIRTVTQRSGAAANAEGKETVGNPSSVWEFPVGGGITARSDPEGETQETWVKAASLLEAIGAAR